MENALTPKGYVYTGQDELGPAEIALFRLFTRNRSSSGPLFSSVYTVIPLLGDLKLTRISWSRKEDPGVVISVVG